MEGWVKHGRERLRGRNRLKGDEVQRTGGWIFGQGLCEDLSSFSYVECFLRAEFGPVFALSLNRSVPEWVLRAYEPLEFVWARCPKVQHFFEWYFHVCA